MQKKGLSGVVTTVIVVFIGIVAVGLVWYFISGFINDSATYVEYGFSDVNLKIVKESVIFDAQGNIYFTVKRESGKGNLSGFAVLVENNNGEQKRYDIETNMGELESKKAIILYPAVAEAKSISIAPIEIKEDGSKVQGKVTDIYLFSLEQIELAARLRNYTTIVGLDEPEKGKSSGGGGSGSSGSSNFASGTSSDYTFNFNQNSHYLITLPVDPSSKYLSSLFSDAPVGSVVYRWNDGSYLGSNKIGYLAEVNLGIPSSWQPTNFSLNLGEAFFFISLYNNYTKTISGSEITSPVSLTLNKYLNFLGIPKCSEYYTASRIIQEVSALDSRCNKIVKFNVVTQRFDTYYSTDPNYTGAYNGTNYFIDFQLNNYEGFVVFCNQSTNVQWTPSCTGSSGYQPTTYHLTTNSVFNGFGLPTSDYNINITGVRNVSVSNVNSTGTIYVWNASNNIITGNINVQINVGNSDTPTGSENSNNNVIANNKDCSIKVHRVNYNNITNNINCSINVGYNTNHLYVANNNGCPGKGFRCEYASYTKGNNNTFATANVYQSCLSFNLSNNYNLCS